jgi:tetrahydromethanopterin S-methyltransferase subunit H
VIFLFRFKKLQEIFEIGGIKIGGQPGELPSILIGSIFHVGHKIVKDRTSGTFNKNEAKRLIKVQEEMSERTGNPCMLDVVGESSKVLVKYIEFISEVTDMPFLINGPNISVRSEATKYAIEIGLKDKVIYDSINYTLNDEEILAIRKTGIKSALIQAFNPKNPHPQGMISILRDLIDSSSESGIKKYLLFMPVLDVPSIGFGSYGIRLAKEEFGMPVGTAPIGVVGRWNRCEEFGRYAKKTCRAGAASLAQSMGANFLIYGSLSKARDIFPVCSMMDAVIAYNARNLGIKPLTKDHPLYKIF